MSEHPCRNCGLQLTGENPSCPTCGLVRFPALPPEVAQASPPTDFEPPNFAQRILRALLPDKDEITTRRMNALFFWGWLGCTLLILLPTLYEAVVNDSWGHLAIGLFIGPLISIFFGGVLILLFGTCFTSHSGDEEDEANEITVGDILADRLREAARKREQPEQPIIPPSTAIKEECPPPVAENIEQPPTGFKVESCARQELDLQRETPP